MKSSCPYCGNNPVPHRIYWYNETINILLTPIRQKLLYNRLTSFFKKKHWDIKINLFFLWLGEKFRIISKQNDIAKCKVKRAVVLWEEAEKRGIDMQELFLFGRPFDTYVAEKRQEAGDKRLEFGGKGEEGKIVFSGLPRPLGYTNRWLDLMDDKWQFKKVMMKSNLPVPFGASCSNLKEAEQIFQEIQQKNSHNSLSNSAVPVIVKPRAGSRGRHSTTFVQSLVDLKKAFKIAKQLCYWVMVEEQLFGPVYRATLVNFELCGVLRGDSPYVKGDGINSIAQLIAIKNKEPHLGVKDIIIDGNIELFLSRQNLQLTSIPKTGEIINLSEKIGVNYGGSSSEDFEICHTDNKELFINAAKVLGDPIVGFDFIIPDITKSWKEQKRGFIEVNSLPFINLHHDPLLGKPRNVAAKVWQMVGW